ncbi:adenylate/guanylate cyclase domain-containing protein [Magnetovibrio sp.]|uniref:adenylate/guanylate cyclase domain-containing protein n=1 Tax=Magnetovibrio sp. TaxID=2024836 RepID=UPI002F959514
MADSTSYEVQVMQGGKWRIHAQFPPSGREDAIEEAKTLESMPGLSGIKVVRDNYDDRTGLHREHMIYKHVPKPSAALSSEPGSPSSGGGKYAHYMARASANRMDDIDFGDKASSNAKSGKTSRLGVFTKLMLVLLFSIAISAIVVGVLNGVLPYKQIAGIKFYGVMRSNIMIGTAIATFLLSVILTYLAFMRGDELEAINLAREEKIKKQAEDKRRQEEAKRKAEEEAQKQEEAKLTKEEEEERKKQAEEELKKRAEEEAKQQDDADAEEGQEEKEEEEEYSGLSPAAEAQKAVLMGFFGEAVRALPAERRKMDNYNRFGVNLYLAGAAESLGGARNLDSDSISEILASSLGVMGLKPEHAQAFAKRYEDYLLQDARYMEMFQSGRQTMTEYLGGDKESPKKLDAFLHEWNKPKAPEDPEKEVVVMFTDIVGSTAMTHEKGNLAAQEVVRAHNRVVREALAKTGGHEIKHTGDGIMASFEKVTDSLLGTQQMQMMIELHNQQSPEIPLKVKIGINAGRVVMEEKDLYGVTVQMAARIVDKAKADQIFVSDTVYGMAKGGSWRFVKRGPYYLKGIDGPAYLQELVWNDKVDIATVEAAAAAERPQLEQLYVAASGKSLPGAQPQPEQPADAQTQPTQPQPAQPQPAQQSQPAQPAQSPTATPQAAPHASAQPPQPR